MPRLNYLLAVAAGALLCAAPSDAAAACTSSTEDGRSYADGLGDDEGGMAPDISGVIMVTTANCAVGGSLSLADGRDTMIDGESVGMYYDIDANPSTGSQQGFKGADRVVITIGQTGADSDPSVGVYNASTQKFEFGQKANPIDVGIGGWGWGIDQIAFQPVTVGVRTIAMYMGSYDTYADFAPEVGTASHGYPVSYSTQAAQQPTQPTQPTQPSQPAQPSPQPTPAPQPVGPTKADPDTFVCKPGKLKGLKVGPARSKAIARGCDVKVKFRKVKRSRRGRVLSVRIDGDTAILTVGKAAKARAAAQLSAQSLNDLFLTVADGRRRR